MSVGFISSKVDYIVFIIIKKKETTWVKAKENKVDIKSKVKMSDTKKVDIEDYQNVNYLLSLYFK